VTLVPHFRERSLRGLNDDCRHRSRHGHDAGDRPASIRNLQLRARLDGTEVLREVIFQLDDLDALHGHIWPHRGAWVNGEVANLTTPGLAAEPTHRMVEALGFTVEIEADVGATPGG
jgi:hypothetical protein